MADGSKNKNTIPLIGLLAVKNQLVTKAELEVGMGQCQGAKDPEEALKQYFLSQELISQKNVQRLALAAKAITIRQKEYTFGAIAVAKGFINKSVLDLALEDQQSDIKNKKKPRLIGDMMVDAGLLTERQRDYILTLQNRARKRIPITLPDVREAESQPAADKAAGAVPEGPEPKKREPAVPEMIAVKADKETGTAGSKEGQPAPGKKPSQDTSEPPAKEQNGSTLSEPERLPGGILLQISQDLMSAFLTKTDEFDEDILATDIRDSLFDMGIVYGLVDDEMIDGFIKSSGFKTQAFRVAKGVRPVEGQDARIEYFFNTDYLKAGGMDEEGNIDFKQRGEIPLVDKGTVLAEKIPRVEARWGHNIYGDEVITQNGEDVPLRFGKGAVLSEDKLKLLAAVRGYPKFSLGGVIFVHEEYVTGGDVDYETGHIEFDGNVSVKGCIKAGFRVKGNDISAVELDGGVVEAQGDLKVAGGINEATVYARGNVYAKFIHNAEIICMGDVWVQKEIVDSTIETASSCVIANGKLISSKVTAKMGLVAQNIGTEMASPSVIRVGHDAFTEREIKRNKEMVLQIKEAALGQEEKQNRLKEQNKELQKEIAQIAHEQDRAQLALRELTAQVEASDDPGKKEELSIQIHQREKEIQKAEKSLDDCFEKSETIEAAIKKVDRVIERLKARKDDLVAERNNLTKWAKANPGKAVVAVDGAILAGTQIFGKHSEIVLQEMVRHARISELLYKENTEEGEISSYQMRVGNF